MYLEVAISIAAWADFDNENKQPVIINGVADAPVANTDAIVIVQTSQLFAAVRARFGGQVFDSSGDAAKQGAGQTLDGALGVPFDLYLIDRMLTRGHPRGLQRLARP